MLTFRNGTPLNEQFTFVNYPAMEGQPKRFFLQYYLDRDFSWDLLLPGMKRLLGIELFDEGRKVKLKYQDTLTNTNSEFLISMSGQQHFFESDINNFGYLPDKKAIVLLRS